MSEIEAKAIELVRNYVETELKTPASEYRIQYKEIDQDSGLHVVYAEHEEDLDPNRVVAPGGGSGKSLKLLIDGETLTVQRVLHF